MISFDNYFRVIHGSDFILGVFLSHILYEIPKQVLRSIKKYINNRG